MISFLYFFIKLSSKWNENLVRGHWGSILLSGFLRRTWYVIWWLVPEHLQMSFFFFTKISRFQPPKPKISLKNSLGALTTGRNGKKGRPCAIPPPENLVTLIEFQKNSVAFMYANPLFPTHPLLDFFLHSGSPRKVSWVFP